jgi:hypothetical protein
VTQVTSAWIRQRGEDGHHIAARTGQSGQLGQGNCGGQDTWGRIVGIGQLGHISLDRVTCQPGQVRMDRKTEQP